MKRLLIVIYLALPLCSHSQSRLSDIRGLIVDSLSGQTLEQASVALIRQADTVVMKQVLSGKPGFWFRRIQPGNYWITVSFIGYQPDTFVISLKTTDTLLQVGRLRLTKSQANMLEVVVKAVIPPVIVKNDTLVYNANSFKTPPNASIEDLLKKLPGMEVDKEGAITLNGQKVEKVYIDGKEFFLGDPKLATQNFTADMLDAIEAFDNQSDQSRFSGIRDNNDSKALNFRLKKDQRKGLFGNVSAGAGTQNNYTGAATATYFKNDRWIFGNVGGNYSDNLSDGKGRRQAGANASINYKDIIGKNLQLVANYKTADNKTESGQTYFRQTFLNDSALIQSRNSFNKAKPGNHDLTTTLTYAIDSFSSIVYTPTVSFRNNETMNTDSSSITSKKASGSYLSNSGRTMNALSTEGYNVANTITYRRRFKKRGRSLYAVLKQGLNQQDQDGNIYSAVNFYDNTGALLQSKVVDQQYEQRSKGEEYGLNVSYAEPIAVNQVIDLGYNLLSASSSSGKQAFNYNPATGMHDVVDPLMTNEVKSSQVVQNFNAGYNKMGAKLQYQVGANVLYSTLKNKSANNVPIEQKLFNWSPRASLFYRMSRQKNLRIQYNGSSTAPTAEMLQPVPDLSNPFLVKTGNPDLKQQFQHRINLSYQSSNSKTFNNFSLQVGSELTRNKIVQSNTLVAGIQELKYVNVNFVYALSGSTNYGFSIKKGKNGSGQLTTRIQYNQDANFVNGQPNTRKGLTCSQRFNLDYHTRNEKLYAGINASMSYNRSRYSIGNNLNTELFSQQYSTSLTYLLPFSIRLASDLAMQINGKQGLLPGRTNITWNASVYRNVFSNNKGEIRFSAFDLLNRNTGFTQVTGDNYIETREVNVLQRYFTLTLKYYFRVRVK